jgi:hypothetical protein
MSGIYQYEASLLQSTGKGRDAESGLDNFGARYDSSSLGRFMSPDAFYKNSHVGDPRAGTSTPTLATTHCGA